MTYHSGHSIAILVLLATLIATPAYAEGATYKCQEEESSSSSSSSSGGGGYSSDCDVRYRDLELKYDGSELEKEIANCDSDCDKLRSIEGSRPSEPMKHITTPLKSLIKDYSPYLYYNLYLEELDNKGKMILKRLYRGTMGDSRRSFSMISTNTLSDKRFAQCVDQIDVDKPSSKEDWAKLVRLQLDNCANQYILYSAIDPAHKENTKKYSFDTPSQPARKIGLYSQCQPLKMRNSGDTTMNEYHATNYIIGAWKKLLYDPDYRINKNADKEPHLPKGIKIKNRISPPNPAPDVRVSMLITTPYEEIIDPSHPFTPRWDFEYNERDEFSPKTEDYGGDKDNEVFCAGDKDENIFKVDVLTFRDKKIKFTDNVDDRIEYNKKCDANDDPVAYPCCRWYCVDMYCTEYNCEPQDCETCFDFSADEPTCTTNYKGSPDRKSIVSRMYWSVPPYMRQEDTFDVEESYIIMGYDANPENRKASCDPNETRKNKDKMSSMCEKLRAPLVPINKLKMRYHNPDEDESEIPSGAMEGMTFKEYFDDHMPYMRLHDTGRSIQESTSDKQDPDDDKGQYTAIVGVGREGIIGGKEDERCLLGGWGGNTNFLGVNVKTPDPVTSWTELKLYQARTARKDGVYCIGRYDKVFKPESSEEKALSAFGGVINVTRKLTGSDDAKRASVIPWPLAWRGYLIDPDTEKQFPNFGKSGVSTITGFDKALPGDMVLLPRDGSPASEKPGLPRVGVVLEGSQNNEKNCARNEDCWVMLAIADNGNAPDICGGTDAMGQLVTRYFFKPGFSKSLVEKDYDAINSNIDCSDQNLQRCEYTEWDKTKIYRVRDDVRSDSGGGTPK